MPQPIKMNKAWLLTWISTYPQESSEQIAGILSARKSSKQVAEVVEMIYLRSTCNAFNMAYYADRQMEIPFKVQNENGHIRCGSNYHRLYARVVSDLHIQVDNEHGQEIITWVEPTGDDSQNYETAECLAGAHKRYARVYLSTISNDRYA